MKVTGEIFGDWDKFERILKNLRDNRPSYQHVIRYMGEQITETIWDLIESQSIDLEPLVKEYEFRKIKEGYDERILIRSGDFINSIQVTDIRVSGYNIEVVIGVEDGITRTGITMKELAQYLEYGTEDMPGREPFKKSWEKMQDDVKEEVSNRLKSIILEDLK